LSYFSFLSHQIETLEHTLSIKQYIQLSHFIHQTHKISTLHHTDKVPYTTDLKKISQTLRQENHTNEASLVDSLLIHSKIIAKLYPEIQRMLSIAHKPDTSLKLDKIFQNYLTLYENEENKSSNYKFALLFIALLLSFIILLSFHRQNRIHKVLSNTLTDLDFQHFAMNQHAVVSETDSEGIITYVNERFCQLSGYSEEEMLGKNHRIIKSNEHPKMFYEDFWKVISSGQVWHGQIKNQAKDGSYYWVNATVVPFLDKEGKPFKYTSIRTEITQQKHDEELLAEKNQFLNLLTNTLGEGVYALDDKGNCIFSNSEAQRLLGYSNEELLGVNIQSLIHFQDKQGNLIPVDSYKNMNAIKQGLSYIDETQHFTHKNGSIFPVRLHTEPLFKNKHFSGSVTVFQDITTQKKTEKALNIAKQKAEEHSQQKSDFLANMSHELRTPMNASIGFCYLLIPTELDDLQRSYLEKIHSSSNVLLNLINDVLDLSKIEAGKVIIEQVDFKLEEIINQLFHVTQSKASEKELPLSYYLSPEIPETLCGDPLRITQILTNLIYNSIKFTSEGSIQIIISPLSTPEMQPKADTLSLQFEVIDTGIGLSKEQQEKLFSAFTQADSSITREHGGTGLGLSISKNLVDLMHGKIGVSSTPEKGSTFYFTLPIKYSKTKQSLASSIQALPEKLKPYTLYVFDNETEIDQITKRMLDDFNINYQTIKIANELNSFFREKVFVDESKNSSAIFIVSSDTLINTPALFNGINDNCHSFSLILTDYDVTQMSLPKLLKEADITLDVPLLPSSLTQAFEQLITGFSSIKSEPEKARELSNEDFQQAQVLLVEDNKVNQMVANALLSRFNLNITIASNGAEAVELFKSQLKNKQEFKVIFMDIQMPIMDGIAATRLIRSDKENNGDNIPIIALTAHALEEEKERCQKAGMNDHITKPIDPDALTRALKRWL